MPTPPRLFLHYLARLKALLALIDDVDSAVLVQRLHPEMAPLLQQASSAIGFTLRASCPLAGRAIVSFAGDALPLAGGDYYLLYAVPNFFFHLTMVYAIARQAGVPIGKADFDGFHAYPPGFRFP